jgi:hypothetical protein
MVAEGEFHGVNMEQRAEGIESEDRWQMADDRGLLPEYYLRRSNRG